MLWRKRNDDGTFPTIRDDVAVAASEEMLQNLKAYELLTGRDWVGSFYEYYGENPIKRFNEGIAFDDFYTDVVLPAITKG